MKSAISQKKSRLTIGAFDGIHIGHQRIIKQLVKDAHANNQQAILVTFFPNPIAYFRKDRLFNYLSTESEKRHIIKNALGVDETIILPFNKKLAQTEAEDFIYNYHSKLDFDHVYIGFNFRFGKAAKGDPQLLESIGNKLGFSVHVFEAVKIDGTTVSSSLIRDLIMQGSVDQAHKYLGRPYSLEGMIVHGDNRGKKIGFPTANIEPDETKLLPANGIYAGKIYIDEQVHYAAVSIGIRPTFYNHSTQRTIEAFILNWSGNIYGKTIKLEFVEKIRDEIKYENIQALTRQIEMDIDEIKEILNNA